VFQYQSVIFRPVIIVLQMYIYIYIYPFVYSIPLAVGRGSSVGIATRYSLDGPGIESQWEARFSTPVQTSPGAYAASRAKDTRSFPGVKRPGGGVDHPSHLAPGLKKEQSYTSTPRWICVACSRVNFTFIFYLYTTEDDPFRLTLAPLKVQHNLYWRDVVSLFKM